METPNFSIEFFPPKTAEGAEKLRVTRQKLAELHPNLDHSDICQLLIRAEQAGGFDLDTVAASVAAKPGHSGRRVQ